MTPDAIKCYKIRDRETGLFSRGGHCAFDYLQSCRGWSKVGKTWSSEGLVKSHLTMLLERECYTLAREIREENPLFTQAEVKELAKKISAERIPETWEIVELVYVPSEKQVFSVRELAARPAKK